MVLFNYATKEITAKIVYYGPGLCGKTTNLQFVYESLPSNNKSKMLSLATKTDRTLFFDFLPLDLGKIRGMRTKLQLYTVPGQVYYNSTRQLVLKGADGVVFVADSQDFALDANQESLQNLEDNLKRQGLRLREMPLVLQYNKRDLPNALTIDELDAELNKMRVPAFPAVATNGLGVEQTLKGITQLVLTHLIRKYGLEGSEPIEKELQVLNAVAGVDTTPESDSLWSDDEAPVTEMQTAPTPVVSGGSAFLVDDTADDEIPVVQTELLTPGSGMTPTATPFDEFMGLLERSDAPHHESIEVPIASVEMKLPDGLLAGLPSVSSAAGSAPSPAPQSAPVPPPPFPTPAAPASEAERRLADGLVREVTLPLNLSLDELKRHRKLKLKITIDVNLLP
jgi:signal recognition particle receptor subunit beta